MNQEQAIECLRAAVGATLLVCPQHKYRIWAQKYMLHGYPVTDTENIDIMANRAIDDMKGYHPWTGPGRARECWIAIRGICKALAVYSDGKLDFVLIATNKVVKTCLHVSLRSSNYLKDCRKVIEYYRGEDAA